MIISPFVVEWNREEPVNEWVGSVEGWGGSKVLHMLVWNIQADNAEYLNDCKNPSSLPGHWGPWKGGGEGVKSREGREGREENGGHEGEGEAEGGKSKLRKQSRPLHRKFRANG